SGASDGPANNLRRPSAARPRARRCARQPTPERLFLTRALTAAVLLAGFLAAVLLLERTQFAIVAGVILALGAREWGRLAGLARVEALVFAAACLLLYGALFGSVLAGAMLWGGALFWIAAVPCWLAAGVSAKRRAWLLAAGVAALVPAGLAMAGL